MLSRGRKIRNHFNGGSKEGKSLRYHFPSWEYPRSCHLKKKKLYVIQSQEFIGLFLFIFHFK